MLAVNPRTAQSERTLAERALELFLTVPNLTWSDAYPLAAYERTAPPVRLQRVLKGIQGGKTFGYLSRAIAEETEADPISADVSVRAWGQRGGE